MALPLFVRRLLNLVLTIKGRLWLSALSEILLLIIFSLFLITSSRQVTVMNAQEAKATEIVQTITEIRFVTFENLLHHDERSYNQWKTKHTELKNLLDSFPVNTSHERLLVDNIKTQQKEVEPVFQKLVASYNQATTQQNIVAKNQYQERLASQLVSKQQIEISSAFKLTDLKRKEALELRQRSSSLAVVVIVLMVSITIANFIFVYTSITRGLEILERGAAEISKARFGYRIKTKRQNDEFGLLAATFNKMAANLEQVDKLKTDFVLLVSHQLRTPATAVKGFISMLADAYNTGLSTKQLEMLTAAYDENERQIQLVNQILAVTQVEAGEMVLEKRPTDINNLIKTSLEENHLVMKDLDQKAVLQAADDLPEVLVDPVKIRIVIDNLISNASKFAGTGTTIKVTTKQAADDLIIEVTDHGVGIAEADLDKLFKKFSRVSNEGTIRTEGTGLGLYLSQRIINLHNGEITVKSVSGKGTTFTVQLPYNKKG